MIQEGVFVVIKMKKITLIGISILILISLGFLVYSDINLFTADTTIQSKISSEIISNVQTCETNFWNTTNNTYIDCVKDYTSLEPFNCKTKGDNSTCQWEEVINYYDSICLDKTEIIQHNETICKNIGEVNNYGKTISCDNAFCLYHKDLGEIHCDLTKDSTGGKGDSNGDGFCQSGEDDCKIIKVNEDKSIQTIKESKHKLEII